MGIHNFAGPVGKPADYVTKPGSAIERRTSIEVLKRWRHTLMPPIGRAASADASVPLGQLRAASASPTAQESRGRNLLAGPTRLPELDDGTLPGGGAAGLDRGITVKLS